MINLSSLTDLPSPGQSTFGYFSASSQLPCLIYRPNNLKCTSQIIVAVHGISRNVEQQLEAYKVLAETHGLWLIAPLFLKEEFPSYQRLAVTSKQNRADLALNRALLSFRTLINAPDLKIHLCGYSGGAQFAHRYALLYPHSILSITLVSAGWYTLIDAKIEHPLGLKLWPTWLGKLKTDAFLQLPILVLVGTHDTTRDKSLRQSKELDRLQGSNRLERASFWAQSTNLAKQLYGHPTDVSIKLLEKQTHDFQENAKNSDMLMLISQFWQTTQGVH